ncbi:GNAT family N-acetyltransferase [Nitrincola sp. MINF-07-Sa-05]|uniref:GNAT family N-acetyltransferase n=1 Tax=Nitrincola salilacus TaxID=3400273 RepID=UPI0039182B81
MAKKINSPIEIMVAPNQAQLTPDMLHIVATGRGSMSFVLGDAEQRYQLFHQSIDWSKVVIACVDQEVVGFLACKMKNRGPYRPDFAAFKKTFGIASALWRFLIFYLVELAQSTFSFYIYGLKVMPRWRRKGVALAMLEAAEQIAIEAGSPGLRLDVSVANTAALALYTQRGYRVTKTVDLFFLPRVFNFKKICVMQKDLYSE